MASNVENLIRSAVTKSITKVADYNRRRLPRPTDAHPYLTGIHTPMTEELTLEALRVEGDIPAALSGRYLRNGPNPALPPDPASYHWFTGAGMVHGIRIADGRAHWYRNRWVRGAEACEALGEPLPPGPRGDRNDAPNTNVVGLAGRTFAIVEAGGKPVELSDTLDSIAHNPFDGTLAGPYSAHPHHDSFANETHAVTYAGGEPNRVWHVVLDADAHVIREEPVAVSDGPSIHDCAITEHYALVFDLPVTFSMKSLLAGHSFPYAWNERHPARIGLLPRTGRGDDIVWVPVDPCYVFHPANAFETADGKVIVDVVAHDTMFARSKRGPDSERSRLERWTIDPAARTTLRTVIDDQPQEFPRYDERLTTRPYRYIYSVALPESAGAEMAIAETRLLRHDLEKGTTEARDFGPGRHPGEFVFVPRAAAGAEDDGWLIGLVVDMNDQTTELTILNADDFSGPPQAVVHLPHRVPPGFHGNWVAD
ncbi:MULTISPECIES: carotenoid oxygenase family protein [Sphingopyxis]|uniref:8'-apo-carotenoid 13,14-cleaving dioxygenase n=1 Tax=Sphingopyxis TaxID=165697 RepID=UPI000868685E|nr:MULTISPECIES: carotenoid oxygenase family protein [Sphingopyxis]APW73242.1 carotenoid oxygenase [Sphingopyxis granuli]AVA14266.1 carotenoid oxygenase [Sphingopyxis sp. MG]ODU28331.1 MAG: carotenoid oxygenase [Sphingopyxis sp. SCN 67-31]